MTSHPIPENAGHWWLCCGKWRVLHAIPAASIDRANQDAMDQLCEPPGVRARAACGIPRRWRMPGLFSRLGRRRCTPCCHALTIPTGYGTPANENDITKDQTT
ncbi:hypothetical protein PV396_24570 [Streptomyces sp. ME02-8801-2C]|uniref:hypothetical protein n=1 Tax=Streptomyces sp. ME02-8801-2C TaxID=3028680 RepID=UPI0029ADB723|nr:hypothetical protein [Streptomyces sp. ME02-8801-2C]MDX3455077.1 hypothetical protein [Streptomyces sp. ME02-8801-2C]